MVFVDLSAVLLSNLFAQLGQSIKQKKKDLISEDFLRHMTLNSLRGYNVKFSYKYGRLILCADNRTYWRKTIFPYYKANRKKTREDSGLDWKFILNTLNKITTELEDNLPYQVLDVPGAEADDIIGTLAKNQHLVEKNIILSVDKDFLQLLKYPNTQQYSPRDRTFLTIDDPIKTKKIHIMRGDIGDGIPNFLSPDDCLVSGKRQTSLRNDKLDVWVDMEPEAFCTTQMLVGFKRNETLIDLDKIPKEIQKNIIDAFNGPFNSNRGNIFGYLVKYRMKNLMEHINEF